VSDAGQILEEPVVFLVAGLQAPKGVGLDGALGALQGLESLPGMLDRLLVQLAMLLDILPYPTELPVVNPLR